MSLNINYYINIYILQVIPKCTFLNIKRDFFYNFFYIRKKYVFFYIFFLKKHHNTNYDYLIDITSIDFLNKKYRFQIVYILNSKIYNNYICIKTWEIENTNIDSISTIFPGANWFEREIWDLFGIKFSKHPDLRRILTDYSFSGFPLRKDFPLSGFFELRYYENTKKLKYQNIKLIQEFRFFDTISPWKQLHIFNKEDLYSTYINKHKVLHMDLLLPENKQK